MKLHIQTLSVLFLLISSPFLPSIGAQSGSKSPRSLDSLIQEYAYSAFVHPRTGIRFDAKIPSNLTGITISGMRLKSGSLRIRGVKHYKEFEIPIGVIVQPYVERLNLVYQNLGNWSNVYYPLSGYTYLSPVLGLLAYNAANLSATHLPELDIRASTNPILIRFSNVKSMPNGFVAKCVRFDLQGTVNFSTVVSKNTCSSFQQGHFGLVVESRKKKQKKNTKRLWIIVGSAVGGVFVLVMLGVLLSLLRKFQERKKMQNMEKSSEVGETLRMTTVGSAKAPTATVTRTQPTLETEYAP